MADSVAGYWDRAVERFGDRPCLTVGADGETFSYTEIDELVNGAAAELLSCGFGRDSDVLFTALPNSLVSFLLNLVVAKLNAVLVPAPPSATRHEMDYLVEHSGTATIVIRRDDAARLGFLAEEEGSEFVCLQRDGQSWTSRPVFDPLIPSTKRSSRPRVDAALQGVHGIYYTSGTTGRPKGVMFPDAGYVTAGPAMSSALGLDASDNLMLTMPLFHVGGAVMVVSAAVSVGARTTLVSRFSASEFWTVVRASGVTAALLMPSVMAILKQAPPRAEDGDNPLRMVWSHAFDEEFCNRFGTAMQVCWGQTETSTMGTVSRTGEPCDLKGFVGRAYPADASVAVCDDQGKVRASGTGELVYRHGSVMLGYYKDRAQTALTLVDGWVRTGDFGEVDAQGRAFFSGRLRHVIKRNGENISGEEVEAALAGLDWVVEAAVFGVPDKIRGEEVLACVRAKPGFPIALDSVSEGLAAELSSWKLPRFTVYVDEPFPRLANGKIDRLSLRERLDTSAALDRESPESATRIVESDVQ
ncbi:hypothetical protein GQ85_08215 [Rhodococcus rhodochrous]|nr:hypothetical protein GQ85_08215 [Rhodococcus rhodochrous]